MTLLRLLPLLLTLPAAAQDLIRVTGVVRQSVSGNPLGNILLSLTRTDAPAPQYSLTSPADGRFAFSVSPGTYRLMAESPAYGGQVYGAASFQTLAGVALRLAPGDQPAPLDFRLIPPATLTGVITDSFGEPVENALLQLLHVRLDNGLQQLSARASARSDDRGRYRFSGLAPGSYYLMVSATPWHSTRAASQPGQTHYRPRFYPTAATPEGASALQLAAGQEAQADFRLDEGEAPFVELNLSPPTPNDTVLLLQLRAPGIRGQHRLQHTEYLYRSEHSLRGVPPGEYEAVVSGNLDGKMVRGVARFALGGTDLSITVPLAPSPTVTGRLDCRGAALALFDPVQVARVQATIQADGTFVTPPVNPGVYSVLLNSRDCYVHRLLVGGQPLPGLRLTVGADPIADLVVETRSDAGSLHGFLRRGEVAQPGVKVYLAPVPWDESRPARQFLTDSDGSFDFERLPPGRYMVYVAPDAPELFEYANPEVIAPYRPNATLVEVAPKQRVRLNLSMP